MLISFMDFKQAYETIVKRSVERNTKEIPTILSCLDFEGKDCLEIGIGSEARLAIKLSGFVKSIIGLEKDSICAKEATKAIKENGVDKKIKIKQFEWGENVKLPFNDNSFDVVFGAWLPHKVVSNTLFLDELARVSRKYILIIMPGIEGDEPKLLEITRKDEKKRRKEIKENISKYLQGKDFKISSKEEILRLEFQDEQEIYDTFKCLAFKNEDLGDKDEKVRKFLSSRVKNFRDGFYCWVAEKT